MARVSSCWGVPIDRSERPLAQFIRTTILNQDQTNPLQVGFRLFGLSFTALFLELMVIRWVPSEVRLVAYYANLMLVSSFLGLGVGAMASSRCWNLFRYFAPLLLTYVLFLLFPGVLQSLKLLEVMKS